MRGLDLADAWKDALVRSLAENEILDLATAKLLEADDWRDAGLKIGTRKKIMERLRSS